MRPEQNSGRARGMLHEGGHRSIPQTGWSVVIGSSSIIIKAIAGIAIAAVMSGAVIATTGTVMPSAVVAAATGAVIATVMPGAVIAAATGAVVAAVMSGAVVAAVMSGAVVAATGAVMTATVMSVAVMPAITITTAFAAFATFAAICKCLQFADREAITGKVHRIGDGGNGKAEHQGKAAERNGFEKSG